MTYNYKESILTKNGIKINISKENENINYGKNGILPTKA